jgi:hypothetical protein
MKTQTMVEQFAARHGVRPDHIFHPDGSYGGTLQKAMKYRIEEDKDGWVHLFAAGLHIMAHSKKSATQHRKNKPFSNGGFRDIVSSFV